MRGHRKNGKSSARQRLVDSCFRNCMRQDARTLDEIRAEVRRRNQPDLDGDIEYWDPTDHDLQIMISRNCMGDGEWEYFPAYTSPPRYVSKARMEKLADLVEQGCATSIERRLLQEMLDDVGRGIHHWRAKHQRARQKEQELTNLSRRISNRAFAGHTGTLV